MGESGIEKILVWPYKIDGEQSLRKAGLLLVEGIGLLTLMGGLGVTNEWLIGMVGVGMLVMTIMQLSTWEVGES